MSRARRRLARALAVLRPSVDDHAVIAGVEDLGRWLEEFHPRSVVELDYGDLVHLLDDAELRRTSRPATWRSRWPAGGRRALRGGRRLRSDDRPDEGAAGGRACELSPRVSCLGHMCD